MKRAMPYVALLVGLIVVTFCWLELLHRIRLYQQYGSQPFLNHVADGYFKTMYCLAFIAITCFSVGIVLGFRSKSVVQIASNIGAAIATIGFACGLFFMHQQDMLVTYSEFVDNMGP